MTEASDAIEAGAPKVREGYPSTILGQPCWIAHHPGTPKAKDECQPFTFEFHNPRCERDVKAQEKFTKSLATLRKREAVAARRRARAITREAR